MTTIRTLALPALGLLFLTLSACEPHSYTQTRPFSDEEMKKHRPAPPIPLYFPQPAAGADAHGAHGTETHEAAAKPEAAHEKAPGFFENKP